ncbi:MAG: helix-turn-helix transcriptional regulator [Bacteroidia bacterium]|nr:helix-turn-helix transcriptional regulator [Bacteroidia bacterium]
MNKRYPLSSSKILIGKTIKLHRKRKELTLQELADKLNSERQYLWKLENGKVNMSLDYLDKVITQLECNHSDFFSSMINEIT